MSIINDWFDKEFYPYHDVLQSLVICGIDYERLIEISLMQTYGNLHSFTAVKNVVYQQIQEMARISGCKKLVYLTIMVLKRLGY